MEYWRSWASEEPSHAVRLSIGNGKRRDGQRLGIMLVPVGSLFVVDAVHAMSCVLN